MKKYLLHIFIFTAITFVYAISIYIYGLKNTSIYNILLFLFASPFLEEFIFRGIVQKNIQKYIKCTFFSYISLANIITSIIFAFAHLITGCNIYVTILLIIPSLYMGLLYDEYKSIKQPFTAHSIFNIIIFINYPPEIWQMIMYTNFIQ